MGSLTAAVLCRRPRGGALWKYSACLNRGWPGRRANVFTMQCSGQKPISSEDDLARLARGLAFVERRNITPNCLYHFMLHWRYSTTHHPAQVQHDSRSNCTFDGLTQYYAAAASHQGSSDSNAACSRGWRRELSHACSQYLHASTVHNVSEILSRWVSRWYTIRPSLEL